MRNIFNYIAMLRIPILLSHNHDIKTYNLSKNIRNNNTMIFTMKPKIFSQGEVKSIFHYFFFFFTILFIKGKGLLSAQFPVLVIDITGGLSNGLKRMIGLCKPTVAV